MSRHRGLRIFAVSTLIIGRVSCFLVSHPVSNHGSNAVLNRPGTIHGSWSKPPLSIQDRAGSKLFSLKDLVEEIEGSSQKQTIFVGGKGGVGKTTISSALAVQLALRDLKVLVVSTDPAHSLGDALDEDLRKGQGKPVTLTDPLTGGRLHASEINAEAALLEFKEMLSTFDVDRLASSLGVSADLLEGLGLREFSGLLNNPPPGLDELVALVNIMDDASDEYDVVVVDTAPTGHTLRLLTLPKFLDGLLGKLIKLRMRLSGLTSTLQAFLGDKGAKERTQTIDDAMDKLENFRTRIAKLESGLKDKSLTSFLVVTIPTKLAVQESKRLVAELTSQGIAVNNVVVNQCVGSFDGTFLTIIIGTLRVALIMFLLLPKSYLEKTTMTQMKRCLTIIVGAYPVNRSGSGS
jgi:arsenite-transporting ATPase